MWEYTFKIAEKWERPISLVQSSYPDPRAFLWGSFCSRPTLHTGILVLHLRSILINPPSPPSHTSKLALSPSTAISAITGLGGQEQEATWGFWFEYGEGRRRMYQVGEDLEWQGLTIKILRSEITLKVTGNWLVKLEVKSLKSVQILAKSLIGLVDNFCQQTWGCVVWEIVTFTANSGLKRQTCVIWWEEQWD